MAEKLEKLRKAYPPVISGDQLYRICHISKRKAKWLLENGVIPCVDTGKKTHRYLIQLEDAICYLKKRNRSPKAAGEPSGLFSSRPKSSTPIRSVQEAKSRFTALWSQEPDALTLTRVSELTGYTERALRRWIETGKLKAVLYYGSYMVPKRTLIECLAVKSQENIKFLSAKHIELLQMTPEDLDGEPCQAAIPTQTAP